MDSEIRESSHDREIKGALKKLDSMSRKIRSNLAKNKKEIIQEFKELLTENK